MYCEVVESEAYTCVTSASSETSSVCPSLTGTTRCVVAHSAPASSSVPLLHASTPSATPHDAPHALVNEVKLHRPAAAAEAHEPPTAAAMTPAALP